MISPCRTADADRRADEEAPAERTPAPQVAGVQPGERPEALTQEAPGTGQRWAGAEGTKQNKSDAEEQRVKLHPRMILSASGRADRTSDKTNCVFTALARGIGAEMNPGRHARALKR